MKTAGESFIFAPSDLNHFLDCRHLLALERARPVAAPRAPRQAQAELLARKGSEHELACLAQFQADGRRVVSIASSEGERDWEADAARTLAAMHDGTDVIYQGVFVSHGWRGISDFLVKVPVPSSLGTWSYEAWDAKLARHSKPHFVLQLCYYSEQLARLQGCAPEWMVVVLGTGVHARMRYRDFDAYYRVVRRMFLDATASDAPTYPYPVAHCSFCEYQSGCRRRWADDDHLSQIAGIRRQQVERLNAAGVHTMAGLAGVDESARLGIGAAALVRLRHQAVLQAGHRRTGIHRYELLPIDERTGFRLLARASPGDIFFDMEGDPFFEPAGGLEYLFGVIVVSPTGVRKYQAFRALTKAQEKVAFEQFIDFVHARLREDPQLHVYHYAPYEISALKRLMSEHATREDALDELLRREVFVDLYQVVRQSLRISHASYSIKKVRTFFMSGAGHGLVVDGGDSVLQFERWRTSGDAAILEAIERYNEEDCVSTQALRDWLLERRDEAVRATGTEVPWKEIRASSVTAERQEDDAATAAMREALLVRATAIERAGSLRQASLFDEDDRVVSNADAAALRLLADLLGYHRRELKPAYWAFFERRRKSVEELLEDTEAIAGLVPAPDEMPRQVQRSIEYAFDFPPQEFRLAAGEKAVDDPFHAAPAGAITRIDAARGRLWLKRSQRRADEALPVAVASPSPIETTTQRRALARVAQAVLASAPDASVTPYPAIADILARAQPRLRDRRVGAPLQVADPDDLLEIVSALDDSYLVVQGPPGSGKTFMAARVIVSLIAGGARIGVTANSHKAINNLLAEVERVAAARRLSFRGFKKCTDEDDHFEGELIENTTDNAICEESDAALVAGTAWLFAREPMDRHVDYLFIDEAGQIAIADAIAMATAARSVVLLGDPQQLPQVRQGIHPGASGASVLEHLLQGEATIGAERGVFLERTWRMHPAIASYISELAYDGRLHAAAGRDRQRIDSPRLCGSGLRYVAASHEANAQQSSEEAQIIACEVESLLATGTTTDCDGETRRVTPADILVVAPYNMQVRCLAERLPAGVEVGTVDRFQGREAPIVFFSMASSTGDDVPRGLEFLFSRNRFNVAISRARAMAVVVCSHRLLETRCRTVEQMRLVNALCRFVEQAQGEAAVLAGHQGAQ
jgi:predicted RecB family nuclease